MDSESQNDNNKEPEVSRFSLDGIVAEMVVEVDEENNGISSPSKTLKLNGLDKYSKMSKSNFKKCSVVLDTKTNLDKAENSGTDEGQSSKEKRNESDGGKEDESDEAKESESYEAKSDNCDKAKGDESKKEDSNEDESGNLSSEEKLDALEPGDLEKDSDTVQDKAESDEEKESQADKEETKAIDIEEEETDPFERNQDKDVADSTKKLSRTPPTKVVQSREVRKPSKIVRTLNKTENTRKTALRSQVKAEVNEIAKSKTKILNSSVKKDGNKSAPENAGKKPKVEDTAKPNTKISQSSDIDEEDESAPVIAPKKRGRKRKVEESEPEVKREEKKLKSDLDEKITRGSNRLSAVKKTEEKLKGQSESPTLTGKRTRSGNPPSSVPEKSRKTFLRKAAVPKPSMTVVTLTKPKAYRFNCNLGDFPHVNKNIKEVEMKTLTYLYQLIYDKLPPNYKTSIIRERVLQFKGFDFKNSSSEFVKRQRFLKTKKPPAVVDICKMLDIKVGSKYNMISDIMNFLMKPAEVVMSVVDPFHFSMQPVIKLERMALDKKYLSLTLEENSLQSPKVSEKNQQPHKGKSLDQKTPNRHILDVEAPVNKRKRFPSSKLDIYVSDISSSKKKSSTSEKEQVEKKQGSTVATKYVAANKGKELSKKMVNKQKKFNMKRKIGVIGSTQSLIARKKLVKLAMKGQKTRPIKASTSEDSEEPMSASEKEVEIKTEPMIESYYEVNESFENMQDHEVEPSRDSALTESSENLNRNEVSDSDSTLSSDEMKEQTNKDLDGDLWVKRGKTSILGKMDSSTKRVIHTRYGKPLRSFPQIKDNIMRADYKALLRVHILLFGASDKAEKNVKGNILAFGGFPFLEGSEEWKQKEFLLSLLAQNNLQEYMTLLCIEHNENDDIPAMIKKLMKFLAAPTDKNERAPEETVRTQVVSSEPVSHAPSYARVENKEKKAAFKKAEAETKKAEAAAKKAALALKKTTPEVKNKKGSRPKKVLMDEEQVRRLEADLAREQRILERERKLQQDQARKRSPYANIPPKSTVIEAQSKDKATRVAMAANQADNELLVALLQTVYKRRALKKAGAQISIPNKGGQIRLGELANVQFLVLTANYNDLDVLHHLIFMTKANKARVRKHILEFAGFNFTEDYPAYKDRMNFLESLGYDISRRIAFLLGLCPFKTPIDKRDLNELIMYFLMAPCQSKQIPIRVYPEDMFNNEAMPHELDILVKKHGSNTDEEPSPKKAGTAGGSQLNISVSDTFPQKSSRKTRKVLDETLIAPPRKTVSASSQKAIATSPQGGIVISTQKAKKSFKSSARPAILKKSALSGAPKKLAPTVSTPSKNVTLSGLSHSTTPILKAHSAQQGLMRIPFQSGTIAVPPTSPTQELYIQQEAPDGTKKTYKLVKLPSNPLLNQTLRLPGTPQLIAPKILTQPVTMSPPVVHAPLPPGLIIFKNNNPTLGSHPLPKVVQTAPLVLNQPEFLKMGAVPSLDADASQEEVEPEGSDPIASVECSYDTDEAEELNPLEDSRPTDDELYMSIQEIIHDSNFEHITLQNVIDRVSAQYSAFDLSNRRTYMKECVRKIIMGT